MFSGENDSMFQNLPSELIFEVFSSVNTEEKKKGRMVCRRWCWILDYSGGSGFFSFKLKREMVTEDSIKSLLKSHLQVDILVLKDFKMTWPIMTYSRNKFPPIRNISLCSGNSEETVVTTLQYGCVHTKSLTLHGYCFSNVRLGILSRMLSGIRWNQLTELNLQAIPHVAESWISSFGWDNAHIKSFLNHVAGIEELLKKATVPNVRILWLGVLTFEEIELSTGFNKLISELLSFIERHAKTLKKLGGRIEFYSCHVEFLRNFPNIPFPLPLPIVPQQFHWKYTIPYQSAEQREKITQNLKLESLEFTPKIFL